jgi:NAD(P)-dependent dehydrogenase (short-subunit alcohol dehydrogenase family)
MASYLITGCSRGLGLEIAKLLNACSDISSIFATARSLSPSLKDLVSASNGRVHFVPLDVTNNESITAAAQLVTQQLGNNKGIDVLIHNAGIQILEKDGATKMRALEESLATNVIGVHQVSAAFLPLLSKGTQKKLLIITSELGSMGNKDYSSAAPFPSYKISKAAVNMLTVQYALELGPKGFTVFCVSPGWLKTNLGGPHADLEPEVGARQVVEIVQSATKEDSGTFRQIYVPGYEVYHGKTIPW